MLDFRNAGILAQKLRSALASMGFRITGDQGVELVSQVFGVHVCLSAQLESVLNRTFAYAKGQNHKDVTVEHLVLFLMEEAEAVRAIRKWGINPAVMGRRLNAFIDEQNQNKGIAHWNPEPTIGFQRVLQRAFHHSEVAGRLPVTVMNVLVATLSEKGSYVAELLQELGTPKPDCD